MKGSKRFGPQMCDSCGREYVAGYGREDEESRWECPHCGFDNKQGTERLAYAAGFAARRKANRKNAR